MIINIGSFGRLGNRLWTLANVAGFAIEHDRRVLNVGGSLPPVFDYQVPKAQSSSKPVLLDVVNNPSIRRALSKGIALSARIGLATLIDAGEQFVVNMEASPWCSRMLRRFVVVNGFYFSAPGLVSKHAASIRSMFALRDAESAKVERILHLARTGADVLVGVHLRRGDYRTFCDGIMFYDDREVAGVCRAIADDNPGSRVRFLLVSDEPIVHAAYEGFDIALTNAAEPWIDMYALSGCDYIVGPNSTFSHWASYFGRVPLHILDYKAAVRFGDRVCVTGPALAKDFAIFDPAQFTMYAAGELKAS